MESRGAAGLRFKALKRRASFIFLVALSLSFPSLFITSANALPSDCRIELRVIGLVLGLPPVLLRTMMVQDRARNSRYCCRGRRRVRN